VGPKAFRITASSNSPRCGSPLREKATAPAFAFSEAKAWARRIVAAPDLPISTSISVTASISWRAIIRLRTRISS